MNDHADNIIVARGTWGIVTCAVCSNGSVPSEEFLADLKKEDYAQWIKLSRLFLMMASNGKIVNREKFKHLEGEIWEFKCFQIRMGCFQVGRSWILTHGFVKKDYDWPKSQVERAKRIMNEHLARGKKI